MDHVARNLAAVHARIAAAAASAGRDPASVRLVAVSKAQPAAAVAAARDAGQVDFGENYLQDALPKLAALAGRGLCWHFIGQLQSNKTRSVAEHFDWVHTLDRESIARRLSEQRPASFPPLEVCLQVNVSGEASKGGVAPGRLPALAAAVAALPRIRLRGLMAIPVAAKDGEAQRAPFRKLRQLLESLNVEGHRLDTLSMGMSEDLEAAVMEGATLVRIGTAVFGPRRPK
ncbi:MAG TPA: YggS family pyridoxal phosphate-dependent enzyme [Gammaproteobacteria bacterium]|nr:YggS family pyridoxal phosphate-dependent enzyme [Gammaproteobacteria bacterium]